MLATLLGLSGASVIQKGLGGELREVFFLEEIHYVIVHWNFADYKRHFTVANDSIHKIEGVIAL